MIFVIHTFTDKSCFGTRSAVLFKNHISPFGKSVHGYRMFSYNRFLETRHRGERRVVSFNNNIMFSTHRKKFSGAKK